jgi:hypothetical protein
LICKRGRSLIQVNQNVTYGQTYEILTHIFPRSKAIVNQIRAIHNTGLEPTNGVVAI